MNKKVDTQKLVKESLYEDFEPRDIENPIAEEDFRYQSKKDSLINKILVTIYALDSPGDDENTREYLESLSIPELEDLYDKWAIGNPEDWKWHNIGDDSNDNVDEQYNIEIGEKVRYDDINDHGFMVKAFGIVQGINRREEYYTIKRSNGKLDKVAMTGVIRESYAPNDKIDLYTKMLDELSDWGQSFLEDGYTREQALNNAHAKIKEEYPEDYKEFNKWLDNEATDVITGDGPFNDAGEPRMTYNQYRDYSEESEPDYDMDESLSQDKKYKIKIRRSGTFGNSYPDRFEEGTLPELINYFRYTLEVGQSWENEKGNKKINMNPKNIQSLCDNLEKAKNNAASNGYGGYSYSVVEETNESRKPFDRENLHKYWQSRFMNDEVGDEDWTLENYMKYLLDNNEISKEEYERWQRYEKLTESLNENVEEGDDVFVEYANSGWYGKVKKIIGDKAYVVKNSEKKTYEVSLGNISKVNESLNENIDFYKVKKVARLLKSSDVDPDIVSPNYVADFAYNKNIKLTSDEVVYISDNYDNFDKYGDLNESKDDSKDDPIQIKLSKTQYNKIKSSLEKKKLSFRWDEKKSKYIRTYGLPTKRDKDQKEINKLLNESYHNVEEPFHADAYLTLSNFGGMEIEINDSGDGLRWRFNYDGELSEPVEAEIEYEVNPENEGEEESNACFRINDTLYFLDEFMRTDY
jgi:hypothetical protein